ncbi:MAG: hypothetical protein QM500_05275, partial [Methylococcales bacterium]
MKNKKLIPLKLALYGMDNRAYKTMCMYLKGPCKGIASVVDESEAEIDLLDADHIKAKDLLDELKARVPNRPLIILSLEELSIKGAIYVKKPVETLTLVAALKQAKANLTVDGSKKNKVIPKPEIIQKETKNVVKEELPVTKQIDKEEKKKVSKHRTAMDLTEGSFSAYIGNVEGVDFTDSEQVFKASYNPKGYFLGFVQAGLKVCKAKNRILQLNSGWKPLIIFPHSQEIWLDVEDKQLRAFAGVAISKNGSKAMSLTPIDHEKFKLQQKMEGFYDTDHFLWKLAVWTSKGRYPNTIDINKPVYLMQWPNFTRLVVTPHAMRISALLIRGPRTAM